MRSTLLLGTLSSQGEGGRTARRPKHSHQCRLADRSRTGGLAFRPTRRPCDVIRVGNKARLERRMEREIVPDK